MQKNNKKFMTVTAILLFACVVIGSVTYAWLAGTGKIGCELVKGSVLTQYFHCGTGTEDDPFVITRPVHYYNLIYLYQRKEGFCNQNYYFQLGYDLTGNDGVLEFYDYDDNGNIRDGQYVSALNMEYYSEGKGGALLPIGTSETPFIGTFDGSGLTVKNLHVSSFQTINGEDYKTCDVGIFGYISGTTDPQTGAEVTGTVKNVYYQNVDISLEGADPLAECHGNASIHDTIPDAESEQDMVFVGYIAGHIKTTSVLDNVYLNNCTITGGTLADSGFGYFGAVEDPETGATVTALGDRVATLRDSGGEAGFGGSINMTNLFNRMKTVLNQNTTFGTNRTQNYPSAETITEPSDPSLKPTVVYNTTTNLGQNDSGTFYRWQTPTAGAYYGTYSTFTSGAGVYLYSLKDTQLTTVTMWKQTGEKVQAWLISANGRYLSTTGTAISNTTTAEGNAKKWLVDANGHWYTYINNTLYYLNRNGTTGIQIQSGIQAQAATVWTQGTDGTFYTTVNGIKYYLTYNGGQWALTPFTESYSVTDGNGHFLSGTATGVVNANSADNAVMWMADMTDTTCKLYTYINGTQYYLGYNNGLTMTTTETTWSKDGDGLYLTLGGEKNYLMYEGSWKVRTLNGNKIYVGSHYLSTNGTNITDSTSANSVNWYFSTETGDTQIYAIIGTNKYYLNYNGNYGLSASTTPVTWHRGGENTFFFTQGGADYYLQYLGGWAALPLDYYIIGDGKGNYMQATGVNAFGNTTDEAQATHFFFSNTDATPDGTIKYVYNNTVYYLGNNNGAFANAETTWVDDGENRLNVSNTTYYLVYQDNAWSIKNIPYRFKISDGNGNYLNGNGTTLSVGNNANNATVWEFSNTADPNNPSGTVRPTNSNNYLRINRVSEGGGGCGGGGTYTYTLQLANTNSNNTWTITNGKLKNSAQNTSDYYLTLSGNTWTTDTTGTGITLEKVRDLSPAVIDVEAETAAAPSVTVRELNESVPKITVDGPNEANIKITFTETEEQLYESSIETVRRGTYVPLRTNSDDEEYTGSDTYGVSEKNTGYIIGGTYSDASGSGQGDIRVSSYEISNINGSYTARNGFSTLYTFAGGTTPIAIDDTNKDNFVQLESVKEKCLKILQQDNSNVYGMHFMNSAISTSHIIQAEYATVMGNTYINYDLPESCIDFNVVEKGYITFMAGDYYSGNNAFFSLHQVFRNEDGTINSIKKISQVYKKKNDEFAPYLYKYSDGSYSGTYVANDYELRFDTSWIENPRNGTSMNSKYIYYFEIPCNAGEYALGSVDGRTGAYLLYLDIGTNGGAIIDSLVSGEGNSDTQLLETEFRTSPDTADHNILQFSINAPATATPENFSVNVVFDKEDHGSTSVSCQNGCYTITVVNKTNTAVKLYVLLCDDDDDHKNAFEYAYKVVYTNNDHTSTILQREVGASSYDYWKIVAGFNIPSSGAATEAVYQSN